MGVVSRSILLKEEGFEKHQGNMHRCICEPFCKGEELWGVQQGKTLTNGKPSFLAFHVCYGTHNPLWEDFS